MEAADGLCYWGVGSGRKAPKAQQGSPCPRERGGSLQGSVSPGLNASPVFPGSLHLTLTL